MAIQATNYDDTKKYSVAEIADVYRPNLLINGDFQCNQRGKSEYTSNGYNLDMWTMYSNGSAKTTLLENGVRVTNTTTCTTHYSQLCNLLENRQYTIVIKASNIIGTIPFCIEYKIEGVTINTLILKLQNGINKITFNTAHNTKRFFFVLTSDVANTSIDIEYIDLFEGDIAYPHVKEDYATALMRCRQFINKFNIEGEILELSNQGATLFLNIRDSIPTNVNRNTITIVADKNELVILNNGNSYTAKIALVFFNADGYMGFKLSENLPISLTCVVNDSACYVLLSCEPL